MQARKNSVKDEFTLHNWKETWRGNTVPHPGRTWRVLYTLSNTDPRNRRRPNNLVLLNMLRSEKSGFKPVGGGPPVYHRFFFSKGGMCVYCKQAEGFVLSLFIFMIMARQFIDYVYSFYNISVTMSLNLVRWFLKMIWRKWLLAAGVKWVKDGDGWRLILKEAKVLNGQ